MPSDISTINLMRALQTPACPACHAGKTAVERNFHFLLWENVNDGYIRQQLVSSLGLCPEHSLLLARTEKEMFGSPLGFSLIYEHMTNEVRSRLMRWQTYLEPSSFSLKLRRFFSRFIRITLPARSLNFRSGKCYGCQVRDQDAFYTLDTLFNAFEKNDATVMQEYIQGNGLCFQHLQQGLEVFSDMRPGASERLVEDAMRRLDNHAANMHEYIRKHDWNNRHEIISPDEEDAWRKVLVFFSGLPTSEFLPAANTIEKTIQGEEKPGV